MFNHVETIHTVFYFLNSISKRVLDYPIALSEFCAWPRSNSHAGSVTLAQEFTLAMTGSSQLQQIPPQQGNAMRFASNVSHVHHKMHQMFDTSNRTSQMRGW